MHVVKQKQVLGARAHRVSLVTASVLNFFFYCTDSRHGLSGAHRCRAACVRAAMVAGYCVVPTVLYIRSGPARLLCHAMWPGDHAYVSPAHREPATVCCTKLSLGFKLYTVQLHHSCHMSALRRDAQGMATALHCRCRDPLTDTSTKDQATLLLLKSAVRPCSVGCA